MHNAACEAAEISSDRRSGRIEIVLARKRSGIEMEVHKQPVIRSPSQELRVLPQHHRSIVGTVDREVSEKTVVRKCCYHVVRWWNLSCRWNLREPQREVGRSTAGLISFTRPLSSPQPLSPSNPDPRTTKYLASSDILAAFSEALLSVLWLWNWSRGFGFLLIPGQPELHT